MPKVSVHSDGDLQWLRDNHDKVTLTHAAERLGVCVDTLKRLLVREGLRDFPGAKYQVARQLTVPMWDRACLKCRKTEHRPKGWFFCRSCRSVMGYDSDE